MTKWTQLHSDVHISGGDGFSFLVIREPLHDWMSDNYDSDEERAFVEMCLPDRKPKVINGVEVKLAPYDALRMYLCESMSATFALGRIKRDYKAHFIIGTRSHRDLFKLNLKFPETENIKVWDSNTQFYVRVADGDDFADDGSASFGHRRERSEEGW